MSVAASDAEDIQRQMRSVRSHLSADVNELVENARDMADWRYYVRRYPWASVAAAAAVGFLLVPTAMPRPSYPTSFGSAPSDSPTSDEVHPFAHAAENSASWRQRLWQLSGGLGSMAASAISRAALAYASAQVTRLLDDVQRAAANPSAPRGSEYEEPHY
jgi:hypothetical protein